MGLSKLQELGMSAFGTSLLRRALPSGRSTPHYLPRSLMSTSSFVKCMLLISFLDHQMKILAKEFGELMSKEFEMSMIRELTFFLGF